MWKTDQTIIDSFIKFLWESMHGNWYAISFILHPIDCDVLEIDTLNCILTEQIIVLLKASH